MRYSTLGELVLTKSDVENALRELPPPIRFAFAPLIKRALGFAVGIVTGGSIALVTAYHLLFDPERVDHIWLLRQYFYGYRPDSWTGVLVGFLWGLWTGFVMGWFLAALRNFMVAVWMFVIRSRENLKANRDFLDHI